jgi:hypothetical protein
MKTKTLISASFAGIGIYYLITGLMTVIISISMITITYDTPFNERMATLQFLAFCMPFIVGVLFLIFAQKLGAVVCRFSKIGEAEIATIIQPEVAIMIACVVTGLTLAISQIPTFIELAGKQFFAAANPVYAANHRYEDYRMPIIQSGFCSLLAVIVVCKARALASWIVSRHEKP